MKIGIYGGTFDPVHKGHIALARKARETYGLDQVLIIPSGDSYMKNGVSDSSIRYEMALLAAREDDKLLVSDMEIRRTGPSYSYETVLELKEKNPDCGLYFIIGEDSLRNIHLWKKIDVIFKNTILLVAGRKERSDLDKAGMPADSSVIRERLCREYGAEIHFFDFDMPVSSSLLRENIHDEKLLDEWLPRAVKDYIIKNHIYGCRL